MIVLPPHSAMEWDALMKALDENGDGTIEYKELFDAIWEDKREFSRGVGAKPTVIYEKDPVADALPQVASVVMTSGGYRCERAHTPLFHVQVSYTDSRATRSGKEISKRKYGWLFALEGIQSPSSDQREPNECQFQVGSLFRPLADPYSA